jgi:hypothetical protein
MKEAELEKQTKRYWSQNGDSGERLTWYVKNLLPRELAYARDRSCLPGPDKTCDLLVLMLGYSPEPLLQMIAAYKPKQVLMVLNKQYDVSRNGQLGKENGVSYYNREFKGAFQLLQTQELNQFALQQPPQILPEQMREAGDNPVEIFRFLFKELKELFPEMRNPNGTQKRIILDITGAKKSMVAGAYLFASFANVPVSYVDFDKYDPRQGKPYGYTCKIDELDNPTEKFRLRDWARLEQLYTQYAFRSALELLKGLISAMEEKFEVSSLFEPAEIDAARRLEDVLKVYKLWDEGNYTGAYQLWQKTYEEWKNKYQGWFNGQSELGKKLNLPTAVIKLGENNYWPHAEKIDELRKQVNNLEGKKGKKLNTSIYVCRDKLLIYAWDELFKINRLKELSGDYRSALLRAAGLTEFLLKARLIWIWCDNKLTIQETQDSPRQVRKDFSEQKAREAKDKQVSDVSGAEKIAKILQGYEQEDGRFGKTIKLVFVSNGIQKFDVFWTDDFDPGKVANLRNKAIHFCIPVSKEFADSAYQHAESNLKEFVTNWTDSSMITVKVALPWEQLRSLCGINFLPSREEP